MGADGPGENARASAKLSALWTRIVVELDSKEIGGAGGVSVSSLGDVAEDIVAAVLVVEKFDDGSAGIAKREAVVGARFPSKSSRIVLLDRAVEELAEEELRAVLVREFFEGLAMYLNGPEHSLDLADDEREDEVDELMREMGFEAEADLAECLNAGWPLSARPGR